MLPTLPASRIQSPAKTTQPQPIIAPKASEITSFLDNTRTSCRFSIQPLLPHRPILQKACQRETPGKPRIPAPCAELAMQKCITPGPSAARGKVFVPFPNDGGLANPQHFGHLRGASASLLRFHQDLLFH